MHTKEPWFINEYGTVLANGHTLIVTGMALSTGRKCDVEVANSRRIVACVNACDGISTENLESNIPIVDGLLKLNEQRDELLAALKGLVAIAETELADPEDLSEMTQAKAAIISASQ